jgi:hypothetical protein
VVVSFDRYQDSRANRAQKRTKDKIAWVVVMIGHVCVVTSESEISNRQFASAEAQRKLE